MKNDNTSVKSGFIIIILFIYGFFYLLLFIVLNTLKCLKRRFFF